MTERDTKWCVALLVVVLVIWGLSLMLYAREQDNTDYYRENYIQCRLECAE